MNEAIKIISDRAEPYYFLGRYCNLIGEFETAYKYLKIAILQDLEQVKKKYVLFVQEHLYNTLTYDELSVACYWTGRYEEGLNYVLKIIDNPKFKDDRQRLLDNKKFFEEKLSVVEK